MTATIAIFSANQGHASLALAAKAALTPLGRIVVYHETMALHRSYVALYRWMPSLFAVPYRLSALPMLYQGSRAYFKAMYQARLATFLDEHRPDLCLSTYFGYNAALESQCRQRGLPLLNVMANPVSTHRLEVVAPTAVNLTLDGAQSAQCLRLCPGARTEDIGWLTRPEFFEPVDKTDAVRQLGWSADRPIVAFSAGSDGNGAVLQLVRGLVERRVAVRCVVLCGNNANLLAQVQAVTDPSGACLVHAVGYTREVSLYVAAANLVVGKAGPNSLFEAVAMHTPFLCISHVAGQEDGNLDLIRGAALGWVEEDPDRALTLLVSLLADPTRMTGQASGLPAMAERLRRAPQKLLDCARRELEGRLAR